MTSQWWGSFTIPHGTFGRWRVGPMTMWIQRLRNEWRVATEAERDQLTEMSVTIPSDGRDLLSLPTVVRFGVDDDDETIVIEPRLADRPVVTRPESPFHLPAGEAVTLYVSTPLWVALAPGGTRDVIEEVPTMRPSDTWFGPNTRTGELCYATRTTCRLRLEELPIRPHRAVTEVRLDNRADSELVLERMQLPVEYLALYQAKDGVVWTQDVSLTRVEAEELAPLRVDPGAPRAAEGRPRLSPPRKELTGNILVRAFSSLFQ